MSKLFQILLVEDDPFDADLTTRELIKIPLANDIVHFHTGDEALKWLLDQDPIEIAVILLDLNMPGMNGIEFLQQVKSHARLRKIPVVVITSSQEHPDVQICYDLGVNAYATKPVRRQEFKEAIRAVGLFWAVVNHPPLKSENTKPDW
jgi:CheY-like chemotaxis protein